jgi:hypothetical protein
VPTLEIHAHPQALLSCHPCCLEVVFRDSLGQKDDLREGCNHSACCSHAFLTVSIKSFAESFYFVVT